MCVDHPGKVGFSISDSTPTSSKEASVHFINFLSNFYKNNAKLGLSKNPLYLGGENYGGRLALVSAEAIISNR
jgi:carboxypeptidase C (cathepsin A)